VVHSASASTGLFVLASCLHRFQSRPSIGRLLEQVPHLKLTGVSPPPAALVPCLESVPSHVRVLDLCCITHLDSLPPCELPDTIHAIQLPNAPLLSPPPNVVERGVDAIRQYLRALKHGSTPWWNCKIQVVGRSTSGKSSLVDAMMRWSTHGTKAFPCPGRAKLDRTVGVDVVDWQPLPSQSHPPGHPLRLRVFDFGGRDVYHAGYSMFMSDNALSLLVVDLSLGTAESRRCVVHWLDMLQFQTSGSVVVVVGTHLDMCGTEVQRTVEGVNATVREWQMERQQQMRATIEAREGSDVVGAMHRASLLRRAVGEVEVDDMGQVVGGSVHVVGELVCVSCTTGDGIGDLVRHVVSIMATGDTSTVEAIEGPSTTDTDVVESVSVFSSSCANVDLGAGFPRGSSPVPSGDVSRDLPPPPSATAAPASRLFPQCGKVVPHTYVAFTNALLAVLALRRSAVVPLWSRASSMAPCARQNVHRNLPPAIHVLRLLLVFLSVLASLWSRITSMGTWTSNEESVPDACNTLSPAIQLVRSRVVRLSALERCMSGVMGIVNHSTFLEALSLAHQAGLVMHERDSRSPMHGFVVTDLGWMVDAVRRVVSHDLLVGETRRCNASWCHSCNTTFSVFTRPYHCERCGRTFCGSHCSTVDNSRGPHHPGWRVCDACAAVLQCRISTAFSTPGVSAFVRGVRSLSATYSNSDVAADLAAMRDPDQPIVHERLLCLELWAEFQDESLPVLLHLLRASGLLVSEPNERDAQPVDAWEFQPDRAYLIPCLLPSTLPLGTFQAWKPSSWKTTSRPSQDPSTLYCRRFILESLPPALFAGIVTRVYQHSDLEGVAKRTRGGCVELDTFNGDVGGEDVVADVKVHIRVSRSDGRPVNVDVVGWSTRVVLSDAVKACQSAMAEPRWDVFHAAVTVIREVLMSLAPGMAFGELVPCLMCRDNVSCDDDAAPHMLPMEALGEGMVRCPAGHFMLVSDLIPQQQPNTSKGEDVDGCVHGERCGAPSQASLPSSAVPSSTPMRVSITDAYDSGGFEERKASGLPTDDVASVDGSSCDVRTLSDRDGCNGMGRAHGGPDHSDVDNACDPGAHRPQALRRRR